MHMRKLIFKGGYGEHGRSCFLVKYSAKDRYYMVDCGIMDTDEFPYPNLTREELGKVDYLFLTHCHKDHSGAIPYIIEKGFEGWIVASSMSVLLEEISYNKIISLIIKEFPQTEICLDTLKLQYGRSGHCPGSIWFYIEDQYGSCFFSGDYQADTLLYACDRVEYMHADIGILDCAHEQTLQNAMELREEFVQTINNCFQKKQSVILPVPRYGRGLEMLYLLKKAFPDAVVKMDTDFVICGKKMLHERCWYKEEAYMELQQRQSFSWETTISTSLEKYHKMDFDILLVADTHIQKESNQYYIRQAVDNGCVLIITGRLKEGSLPMQLYKEGKALRCVYPHHQSCGDLQVMMDSNDFHIAYPYHNPLKEIYVK
ncbi:MAG: MBL fold metallo-hydrolase [Lachnospiraceae bacterium]|nr:MBL fold metallo-hydrolase [Lachnospiraceae bacterium]